MIINILNKRDINAYTHIYISCADQSVQDFWRQFFVAKNISSIFWQRKTIAKKHNQCGPILTRNVLYIDGT